MSSEQREIHDAVVSGPRGRMVGPLLAAIHSPELARRWSALGELLRFGTCLPKTLSELAILVCGRRWSSQIEWWVHARAAADAGLAAEIVEAIRLLQPPPFRQQDQHDVYEFTRILQATGQVPADLHGAVRERWGTRGVVELTALVGYYTMVALTLNAHEIPLPEGVEPPLERCDALCELAPGSWTA